jgi:hypothetical protein
MSKKKNTLKDLDAFLKQQAATLVNPPRIAPSLKDETTLELEHDSESENVVEETISSHTILQKIRLLSAKEGDGFKSQLYDLILKSVETQREISAEDKMLINTVLYIKSGSNWKETIRQYWKNRAS